MAKKKKKKVRANITTKLNKKNSARNRNYLKKKKNIPFNFESNHFFFLREQ